MKIPKARKLPSGSWFIQLRLNGESIPITAGSEAEVKRLAQLTKAEYLAGKRLDIGSDKRTVGQLVDAYISDRSNVLSPATIRGYRTIRRCRFHTLMDRTAAELSSGDWIQAVNAEAALCSPKTLSNAWRFLATAMHAGGIDTPNVTLPQIPPNEHPYLEPDQIKPFIEAVKGSGIEIPVLLGLSSLRLSEICALDWSDVDLKKRRIRVAGAAVIDEHNQVVHKAQNKNRSSTRYVPIMMDELYAALERERQPSGPVVSFHPNSLRNKVNRVCKRLGFPLVGAHGLRHSFASLCYHLGVPEKVAMEIGGWSDYKTMRNIYTHIAKSDISKYENELTNFFKRDS